MLTKVAAASDGVYYELLDGIQNRLFRIEAGGVVRRREIQLPVVGAIDRIIHDPRRPGVILPLSAWAESTSYYALDSEALSFSRVMDHRKERSARSALEVDRVMVRSRDGTLVPLTIVRSKGSAKDGQCPTLLTGYGAYGISQTPNFDLARDPWFKIGGVYAVAHVRGGGELGEAWRLGGMGSMIFWPVLSIW